MMANLPGLKAQDLLDDPDYCGKLGAEAYYDLILAATGDKDIASKRASDRAWAMMDAGLKP